MLSPVQPYIVRKDSCGVRFSLIIADEVARLWYDTPPGRAIPEEEARGQGLEVDRDQPTG